VAFELSRFLRRAERRGGVSDEAAIGDAVAALVEARMRMLRAALETRAAFLRAQSVSCDSVALKNELAARIEELEFILGQTGG